MCRDRQQVQRISMNLKPTDRAYAIGLVAVWIALLFRDLT